MKKRKIILIISAVVVVALLFYITDMMRNWNELSEKEETAAEEKMVTLDWYINFSWFATEWGESLVSQEITKKTGVDINFVVPKGNESEKIRSMIESDTLPDMITVGWWGPEGQEMISKGQVYALNILAEKYDSAFFSEANEDTVEWYTRKDGNIYGYPNYSYTYQDYTENSEVPSNQNFLVRKDIYEAIGSPDMTTPEGFEEAVKKAAEMFPVVDGKSLIPVGADEFTDRGNNSFDVYLQNFLAVPYEKDGKYYDRNTDPEYIRWLKVFRKLGEEGYLKNDIFVDKRSQLEEKIRDGRYFCLLYQSTDIEDQEKVIFKEDPERIYIAVDGPKNSRGDDPVLPVRGINGWTVTYISKNCEHPEKALEMMTYMLSEEGQKTLYYGVEGAMYQVRDGEIITKPEILELLNTDRKKYDELYGAADAYWMLKDSVAEIQWRGNEFSCVNDMKKWTYPYTAYTGQYDMNFGEDSRSLAIYNQLLQLWSKYLPKLLLAKSEEEFDIILEKYCAERENKGYEEFCRSAERVFQSNKERLGIEE
ncbi:extracellular solute-binding protein [Blautia sp. An81]|uniref:extracellular solute-binding protein n=1 Tax=Blautia sp. An81 TaxID=1965659 RepID=UPI000B371CA8|nr:extracellular solute-binding protein [Blautia sp. An81]OUN24982.1 ABC transporter substrate-binding protein [Blautia sp. An81]